MELNTDIIEISSDEGSRDTVDYDYNSIQVKNEIPEESDVNDSDKDNRDTVDYDYNPTLVNIETTKESDINNVSDVHNFRIFKNDDITKHVKSVPQPSLRSNLPVPGTEVDTTHIDGIFRYSESQPQSLSKSDFHVPNRPFITKANTITNNNNDIVHYVNSLPQSSSSSDFIMPTSSYNNGVHMSIENNNEPLPQSSSRYNSSISNSVVSEHGLSIVQPSHINIEELIAKNKLIIDSYKRRESNCRDR